MLFENPALIEGIAPTPQKPAVNELHFVAQDAEDGSYYGLTIPYLRSTVQSIRGGAINRFDVSNSEISWLFQQLDGDRLTHYRRAESRKKTYRPIYRMGIRANGIIITSYYSAGRIAVDFTED